MDKAERLAQIKRQAELQQLVKEQQADAQRDTARRKKDRAKDPARSVTQRSRRGAAAAGVDHA